MIDTYRRRNYGPERVAENILRAVARLANGERVAPLHARREVLCDLAAASRMPRDAAKPDTDEAS